MRIAEFLFGRQGRFARVHWWVALLFWSVVILLVSKAVALAVPFQPQDCATRQTPGATTTICITSWRLLVPMLAVLIPASLPPMLKRLHDRERRSLWAFVYLAAVFTPLVAISLLGPELMLQTSPVLRYALIAGVALTGLGVLATFVELGFLRGTKGPNAYGPEPRHFANLRG